MVASSRRLHCFRPGIRPGFLQPFVWMQFLLLLVDGRRNLSNFVDSDGRMAYDADPVLLHDNNKAFDMKTVKIGEHDVQIYDAIDELPVARFHKYQKYLLVDAGIGSTIQDFDKRIEKMRRYCMLNDTANAQKEVENMRQCVYMIQNGLSTRHLAFACLVFAIDGVQYADISDDSLQKIVETFADAPIQDLTDRLESVKKKIDQQLTLYFPKCFNDSSVKEYYEIMRRRTLAVLQNIARGVADPDATTDVEKITTELITYSNPQNFNGPESAEIQFDREFENLCLVLSQNLNISPKNLSVLEFYNAFEYLKEKARETAKQAHTRR